MICGNRGVFLLALLAVGAVAAIDAAAGSRAVLIGLFAVGPIVATFGATTRETAIVAVVAIALAIPLGLTVDDLDTGDLATRLLALGLISGLAVGVARLRSDRERDASRLAVQYRLARVLTESDSLSAAGPRLLEAIAEPLGWDFGAFWVVRGGAALRPVATWTRDGFDAHEFESTTSQLVMGPGFGLPGTV